VISIFVIALFLTIWIY